MWVVLWFVHLPGMQEVQGPSPNSGLKISLEILQVVFIALNDINWEIYDEAKKVTTM